MATAVKIFLDISTPEGRICKGLNSRDQFVFGNFYQGSLVTFNITPVIPTGNATAPFYSKVPLTNLNFQLVYGPRAGVEAIKVAQYTWNKQSTPDAAGESGYFYADVDFNTTDLNTAIGSSDAYSTYLEFRLSEGGLYRPVHQVTATVVAVVKDPGSASSNPTPAASYLTRDECLDLFVMWNNTLRVANAGRTVTLVSPDQAHTREIGTDNNGAPVDNLT